VTEESVKENTNSLMEVKWTFAMITTTTTLKSLKRKV
jgi:hypothetical protein